MRMLSFLTGLAGMFMAGALAAQTPVAPSVAPPPPPPLEVENSWHLDLSSGGRVTIQLRPDVAPVHVERIKTLTRRGFYDGLIFHRVIEGFMAQGGDPQGTGAGGSDLANIAVEIRGLPHVRGAVGMARADALDSANSQFYIMFVPRLNMDGDYTIFGRVVSGMNFVDAIVRGDPPLEPTRIVRASIGSDNVPPMSAEELRVTAARQAEAHARAQAALAPPALSLDGTAVPLPTPAPDAAAPVAAELDEAATSPAAETATPAALSDAPPAPEPTLAETPTADGTNAQSPPGPAQAEAGNAAVPVEAEATTAPPAEALPSAAEPAGEAPAESPEEPETAVEGEAPPQ